MVWRKKIRVHPGQGVTFMFCIHIKANLKWPTHLTMQVGTRRTCRLYPEMLQHIQTPHLWFTLALTENRINLLTVCSKVWCHFVFTDKSHRVRSPVSPKFNFLWTRQSAESVLWTLLICFYFRRTADVIFQLTEPPSLKLISTNFQKQRKF